MPAPLLARPRRKDEGGNEQLADGSSLLCADGSASLASSDWVIAWAPVVAWMLVILTLSGDSFSAAHTATWLAWSLGIGFGEVAPQTFQLIHLIVRKSAHLVEYCMLGLLVYRGLHRTLPRGVSKWWLAAVGLLPVLLAAIDELHQLTVPSRTGSVTDVGIDTVGAWLGLTMGLWASARRNS